LTFFRAPVAAIGLGLVILNAAAWAWALVLFHDHPTLIGTALLAYTFGLRHAVDADHIAAIDNVSRGLMQRGQRPIATGLYFSLGHSTVVLLASAGIAAGASVLDERYRAIGGVAGSVISAGFLIAIAGANVVVLRGVWRTFQRVRAGGRYDEEDLDLLLSGRGLLARLFRPVFRLISASWHMYPLGFLFGLGFDTASEIGVLGMSAAGASRGLPIWSIMVFPALFTAGMTLIDTADGILMVRAYGWAFVRPIRKLWYNLTMTAVSVVVAVAIGGIELLGLIGDQLGLETGFWRGVAALNDGFGMLGFVIIGVFAGCFVMSVLIWRAKGFDRVEVRAD
jgi:nickel/cobalt transporter (NiCoT) family protein